MVENLNQIEIMWSYMKATALFAACCEEIILLKILYFNH